MLRKEQDVNAALIERYESERDELIALRNYVYSTADEHVEHSEITASEMISELSKHSIVVIGGHVGWTNKLKSQLTGWTFIQLQNYHTVDTRIFDAKERVYFFTGYLNHISYVKYVAILREKKIPFGYLGCQNVNQVMRQVYEDLGL